MKDRPRYMAAVMGAGAVLLLRERGVVSNEPMQGKKKKKGLRRGNVNPVRTVSEKGSCRADRAGHLVFLPFALGSLLRAGAGAGADAGRKDGRLLLPVCHARKIMPKM